MGKLISGGSKPKTPVVETPAMPVVDEGGAATSEMRRRIGTGFRKTVITGALVPPGRGRKTVLG